ncbi:MAG: hypothetical protein JXM69_10010 [Anaerolineae bacterium]|nr:hypothetical protein [Anaerolineae bacterium]
MRHRKLFVVANQNQRLSFEEVVNIVKVSVRFNLVVGVLCWTQTLQTYWQTQTTQMPLVEVMDVNKATLPEWQTYLSSHPYDVLIFHGAQMAQQAGQLSLEYAESLVSAVPVGLMVWL